MENQGQLVKTKGLLTWVYLCLQTQESAKLWLTAYSNKKRREYIWKNEFKSKVFTAFLRRQTEEIILSPSGKTQLGAGSWADVFMCLCVKWGQRIYCTCARGQTFKCWPIEKSEPVIWLNQGNTSASCVSAVSMNLWQLLRCVKLCSVDCSSSLANSSCRFLQSSNCPALEDITISFVLVAASCLWVHLYALLVVVLACVCILLTHLVLSGFTLVGTRKDIWMQTLSISITNSPHNRASVTSSSGPCCEESKQI